MSLADPREHQHRGAVAQQFRHDLIGAGIVDTADAREVDARDRHLAGPVRPPGPPQSRDRLLDPLAHHAAGGTRDQVRVEAGDGLLEHRMHVDVLYHGSVDPCSGMMMRTWAPGKGGRPSFSGTSSSHFGTIAMRAVPLRIAIFPSQRTRYRRIPASPWPRPGSRNRLTPCTSAASSAAASPQRSPNRLLWVGSRECRNPTPASATAITTTRRANLRRQWHACTATHPPVPACSTIF